MTTLIYNIKELLQIRPSLISKVSGEEMKHLPSIKNAFLVIENDIIADFGTMNNCPPHDFKHKIDASNKVVLPAWCDSHTHLVYAGNRVQEFVDRINGFTYEEIAAKRRRNSELS